MLVGALFLPFFVGCSDRGIELELHLPKEPSHQLRLEVFIDTKSGTPPCQIRPGVYAIRFDESGVAVVDSLWALTQWQKKFLITPTRRLARNDGYELLADGLKKGLVTERLPSGGVQSHSVEHGSKYWMDIKITDPRTKSE